MITKNNLIKLNGIIIKETDYNEYDKLLTILTREKGKISAYAFNVRRSNSKNIGKVKLFALGTFELRENNESYTLENIIIKDDFSELTNDYENVCYASYFIELADYFSYENIESEDVIDLLYFALKSLIKGAVDKKLIRRVYELKLLKYQGEYKDSDSLLDKNETLKYTWDFVINSLPQKLFTFKLSDEIFKRFSDEVAIEMRDKVNKKFKSLNEIFD
jgi:DNA repair protein RecO (recombination protein O)